MVKVRVNDKDSLVLVKKITELLVHMKSNVLSFLADRVRKNSVPGIFSQMISLVLNKVSPIIVTV